jgi:ABC-type hemin transport system ATPase subunit
MADEQPPSIHERQPTTGRHRGSAAVRRPATTYLHRPCRAQAAPITILDEATAALDPENTGIVHNAITTLAERGSVLVIAHNMSTVRAADTILVLDQGSIVDRGTHHELIARPGLYADYTDARHAADGWSLAGSGP